MNDRMDGEPDRARDVRALIAAQPLDGDDTDGRLRQLCSAAAQALAVSGVAVTLTTQDGAQAITTASDPLTAELVQLQFTIGEGPSLETHAARRPVLLADLDLSALRRWPGFCAAAHDRGVRAVFAFPLQVGAARLGVLDAYRRSPGGLAAPHLRLALSFTDLAVRIVLDDQAGAPADGLATGIDQALGSQVALYQAQGMIMVDLGISIRDAAARLRAHAYAVGRPVHDVAHEVVTGRLRLDRDEP